MPIEEFSKAVLTLINRKNDQIKQKDDEIDLLQKAIQVQEAMLKNQDYAIKTARAEAIKEFAERVKEELTGWETDPTDEEIEFTIAHIAKEMGVEL
jgi:DNA repair ATPase RecN